MDINDFYLNNHTDWIEQIMIHASIITEEFMTAYNIKEKVHNEYIYERVTKGMYVLP